MASTIESALRERYQQDGYLCPVDVLTAGQAAGHRAHLERLEAQHGPLHYKTKPYLLSTSAYEICRHPRLLDAVEAAIGPDILLWDSAYIIKEPGEGRFVSWHQDLTYWGLDSDRQVTAWLALSPATPESGCMQVIPGSHHEGAKPHDDTRADDNILHRGQDASRYVDESKAIHMSLEPGQASLHHGWLFHGSGANRSDDRRIGLSLQFVAPSVRQLKATGESATLVRGRDAYGHFAEEPACTRDFAPENVAFQAEAERLKHAVYDSV